MSSEYTDSLNRANAAFLHAEFSLSSNASKGVFKDSAFLEQYCEPNMLLKCTPDLDLAIKVGKFFVESWGHWGQISGIDIPPLINFLLHHMPDHSNMSEFPVQKATTSAAGTDLIAAAAEAFNRASEVLTQQRANWANNVNGNIYLPADTIISATVNPIVPTLSGNLSGGTEELAEAIDHASPSIPVPAVVDVADLTNIFRQSIDQMRQKIVELLVLDTGAPSAPAGGGVVAIGT